MTPDDLRAYYQERKDRFSAMLTPVRIKIAWVSHARLATAVAFLVVLYLGFRHHDLLPLLAVGVVAFVFLVQVHGQLFTRKERLEHLIEINDRELRTLRRSFEGIDDGAAYIDVHHPYSHDLDLFGEGSLFQYINRSNTVGGKKSFASCLTNPPASMDIIQLRAAAIAELATENDLRQELQAAGLEMNEEASDKAQLLTWADQGSFVFGKPFYRIVLMAVPAITMALIAGAFFSSSIRPFALLMVAIQWGFVGFHGKRVNAFHDYISRKKNILQKYAVLLGQLQGKSFSSRAMARLAHDAQDADRKVAQLASLVRAFDARLNSMTFIVVNSVLLYDLQCVYRLERWKARHSPHFGRWLDAIAEAEVFSSLATFAFNHPSYVSAEIQSKFSIVAKDLGHPLLPEGECIPNDLAIGDNFKIMIVTGANMAGKSTFLRTLGVNIVLALNGAPVSAKSFRCPVLQLRTGMRTADSLKDHQSYFYAELDRLSGIMRELRQNTPLLILLDEILKGTNSTDKQTGSMALVRQLLPHPCLAVIATHDLALGDLEEEYPAEVRNFCFEANIEADQLSFDYKLKPGLATKMNATFLMKKMGIIPS